MKKLLLLFLFPGIALAQTPFNGKLGYGISPAGFPANTQQAAVDFYTEVSANPCGGTIMWGGSWFDSVQAAGVVPTSAHINAIATAAFPYEDINVFTFYNYPSTSWIQTATNLSPNDFTNVAARDSFLNMLGKHAAQDHPSNLFVGNEIDLYYEMDSLNFPAYATFYSMAYDTIKKYSPTTKVGVVFQHEHLTGQGTLAAWNTPYFQALHLMDTSKMDQIGLTLYPFFNYQHANQVNSHYLDAFRNEVGNKEIVITETGWPADHNFPLASWTCSPQEQADLVPILFDSLAPTINCHKIQWLYLNYLMSNANDGIQIFRSVAMRDSLGNDRPAKALWDARCQAPSGVLENELVYDNKIFPNPAQDIINIPNDIKTLLEIHIVDLLGNEIYVAKRNETDVRLSVADLPTGIYFVIISSTRGTSKQKLIINR